MIVVAVTFGLVGDETSIHNFNLNHSANIQSNYFDNSLDKDLAEVCFKIFV